MIEVPVAELTTDYKKLLESLTVTNPAYTTASFFGKGYVKKSIPKKLFFFRINKQNKTILIPRGIEGKYFDGEPKVSLMSEGTPISEGCTGKFKLRPEQQKFFDTKVCSYINNVLYTRDTNIKPIDILLNAECGSGKTAMALYLSSLYKVRTIVAVTTKKIGNQFKDTVSDLFPDWTCGWEDGKNEYDITLSTYSLLSKDNYTEKYFSKFGHIILDEYHRCGADTYSIILEKASCRFRTSNTATFRRKDGLHKILKLHAGEILEMKRDSIKAKVYPIHTGYGLNEDLFRTVDRLLIQLDKLEEYTDVAVLDLKGKELDRGMVIRVNRDTQNFLLMSSVSKKEVSIIDLGKKKIKRLGNVSAPMMDTEIALVEPRTFDILDLIKTLHTAGRKVIVLSKRKEQLFDLEGKLKRRGIKAGVFVSEKAKEYKDYCKRKGRTIEEQRDFVFNESRVILGIDKLAEEGMDVPSFDTLIYLHPIKDIEQSIGRILRKVDGKREPIAFYLIDEVNMYGSAFNGKKGAKKMFESLGHTVEKEKTFAETIDLIEYNELQFAN